MGGPLSVAEVLERAADLIEPEGAWASGTKTLEADGSEQLDYYKEAQAASWTIVSAISVAAKRYPGRYNPEGARACTAALRFFQRVTGQHPYDFNIAPERTQAEVVAKLREAAALAREQGK